MTECAVGHQYCALICNGAPDAVQLQYNCRFSIDITNIHV